MESENLRYIETHQNTLHVDLYRGYDDNILGGGGDEQHQNNEDNPFVVLLSSFYWR